MKPSINHGPSLSKLSLIALLLAVIILILLVLPATDDTEVTGVAKNVALNTQTVTDVSELSSQQNSSLNTENSIYGVKRFAMQKDTLNITIPARGKAEYRLELAKHSTIKYSWQSNGKALNVDFQGKPKGEQNNLLQSYVTTTAKQMSGQYVASFTGSHGWLFKNTSSNDIEVTISTEGPYRISGIR